MIETDEGVSVAGIGLVSDLVGTQDVGGEAADVGHNARVLAHCPNATRTNDGRDGCAAVNFLTSS